VSASDSLVLVGGDSPHAPMAWVLLDSHGEALEHGVAGPGQAPPSTSASRTTLVIPGAEATVRRLQLQASTEAQARALLPHLFERGLAAQEGEIHYAVGARQDAEGNTLAVAVSAERLGQWLDRCKEAGAAPSRVMLDFTVWPVERGRVEVVETPRLAMVAAGELGGFSIEPSLAPHVLTRWLQQAPERISSLSVMGGDAEAWAKKLGTGAPEVVAAPRRDPLLALAGAAVNPPAYAPNLLQGSFTPASKRPPSMKLWRFAVVLALLAVALQVGSYVVAGWRDRNAAAVILESAEADFRTARPEVKRIVNLRAQVRSMAASAQQASSHPVLATTDPLIKTVQANPTLRLDELRHEQPGRKVSVRLSAAESAPLEGAAAALRQLGLKVEAGALRVNDGRYSTDLVVEAP
jgi:general secretion pathway protein L